MSTEFDNDLLREGITRYRAKEYDSARGYIQRALDTADDLGTRAQANYYLSLLTDDPIQKRNYLEETLAIDITNAGARRALAILDGKLEAGEIVDANALPIQATGTADVQADRFTCPKCGGRLVYTPDGNALECEYCDHRQELSKDAGGRQQDFFIAMANGSGQRAPVAVPTFHCQGCGANFVLAPDEISVTCAYCGSSHVVAMPEKRLLVEPDSILPMNFDREQAGMRLVEWAKKNNMTFHGQFQTPRGLYLPVWVFELFGNLPWNGVIYRNKRAEPISGEKELHFDDLHVLGSKKLAGLMQETLDQFDLSKATAYDARFLAGWMADVYDLPMAEASLEARRYAVERVKNSITQEFGSIRDLSYSSAQLMISAFKLVLVPVWLSTVSTDNRDARILINGRSGTVVSEIHRGRVARWLDNLRQNQ